MNFIQVFENIKRISKKSHESNINSNKFIVFQKTWTTRIGFKASQSNHPNETPMRRG